MYKIYKKSIFTWDLDPGLGMGLIVYQNTHFFLDLFNFAWTILSNKETSTAFDLESEQLGSFFLSFSDPIIVHLKWPKRSLSLVDLFFKFNLSFFFVGG